MGIPLDDRELLAWNVPTSLVAQELNVAMMWDDSAWAGPYWTLGCIHFCHSPKRLMTLPSENDPYGPERPTFDVPTSPPCPRRGHAVSQQLGWSY